MLTCQGVLIPWLLWSTGLPASVPLAGESAPCNNTYSSVEHGVGIDPSSVVTTQCAVGSIEVQVKITTEGSLIIVDAETEGSVKVTITTPPSCEKSWTSYSDNVYACSLELEEWHCNPQGRLVRQTLNENLSPCPQVNDVLALINDYIDQVAAGNPFTIPVQCEGPEIKIHQGVWSATVMMCAPSVGGPPTLPLTSPEWVEEGGMVHVRVSGMPSKFQLESLLPDGAFVMGMSSANTSDGLAHALPTSLPPGIGALLERYGPIAHLNDLRCEILRTSASLDVNGEPGVLRDTAVIVADLWGDGDLSMERHLTLLVSSGTAEAMPYPFTERWSRVDGDVLYCQSGGEMATVYPERNGAGSFIAQSDMLDGQRLSQWLTDPFEFSRSGSPWVGPAYDDAGFARYERRRHGGYDHLIVDEGVSTAPLVRELRHHSLSGALLRRVMFDDERDVLPGAPRPMLMVEEILGGEGTVVEAIEYRFSGRPDVLAQEPEVELPEPLSDVWSIWVR